MVQMPSAAAGAAAADDDGPADVAVDTDVAFATVCVADVMSAAVL